MARKSKLQKLQEQVQLQELHLKQKMLEAAYSLYDQPKLARNVPEDAYSIWDSYVPPWTPAVDTPGFFPLISPFGVPALLDHQGRGEDPQVFLNWWQLKIIRDGSRWTCNYNPYAVNALENRQSYVVGNGYKYRVAPRPNKKVDPQLVEKAQTVLDTWMDQHDWHAKEQEVVFRCDRDGEAFLRFFDTGQGRCEVRFVEPEYVRSNDNNQDTTFGIVTDPDDIHHVTDYWIVENPQEKGWTPSLVSADEVIHFKINVDSAVKRGLPTLFPVMSNLERAVKLLRNMSILAQVQATFAVIRKHKGSSSSAVQAFQQANADWEYTDPQSGASIAGQRLKPGSIYDSSANTDWEFPSAHVEAGGYVQVLQAELRAIASRLCMPEFMLSADASQTNYASTLVAESPAVKSFERLQQFYSRLFGHGAYYPNRHCGVMWRVLRIAVEGGLLPEEVLDTLEIQTTPPSTIVRDKLQEAQRNQILHQNGVLGTRAWAEHEGLDYENQSAPSVEPEKLLALQSAYFGGQVQRDAAIANAKTSWHLSDKVLAELFPEKKQDAPPQQPPGTPPGPQPPPPGSGQSAPESMQEDSYFANCKRDEHGHCTSGGGGDTGTSTGKDTSTSKHDAKAVAKKLAPEIKELKSTSKGRAVLKKGKALADKAKAGLHTAIHKGLEALDTKGGVSLILHGVKKLDASAMAAGAGVLFGAVFEDVHEEVFENALSQHSLPGAHAIGVVAAGAAAKVEGALIKAVAWSFARTKLALVGHEAIETWNFTDEAIEMAVDAALNTLQELYKDAGVEAELPDSKDMVKRVKKRLEAK